MNEKKMDSPFFCNIWPLLVLNVFNHWFGGGVCVCNFVSFCTPKMSELFTCQFDSELTSDSCCSCSLRSNYSCLGRKNVQYWSLLTASSQRDDGKKARKQMMFFLASLSLALFVWSSERTSTRLSCSPHADQIPHTFTLRVRMAKGK